MRVWLHGVSNFLFKPPPLINRSPLNEAVSHLSTSLNLLPLVLGLRLKRRLPSVAAGSRIGILTHERQEVGPVPGIVPLAVFAVNAVIHHVEQSVPVVPHKPENHQVQRHS